MSHIENIFDTPYHYFEALDRSGRPLESTLYRLLIALCSGLFIQIDKVSLE